ncbi:dihydropteroate synthase [Halochromatium salexigens]|uniref:Dihydropteroate synthase n=1 Tax=Halochromatium salexigens TaxID=49447 RepID=A0AAJ0XHJ1_HALSE|nr:dihydropteroate synthase [Halochromatium salexigens]MBK5931697.1 dihydropteroate synthase [Halochromatium salexigens]
MTALQCGDRSLDLTVPRVMGILNVTPDSFSDGGDFVCVARALAHAEQLVAEGAAIIDVGGESTRPGAEPVPEAQEIDRVVPVIEALSRRLEVPISIDTSKPEVMRTAARAGAGMINDVFALQAPGALRVAAETGLPVCLMHMQGLPRTMQHEPRYADVVAEVIDFLRARIHACEQAGIARHRLVLDPGFGFGKRLAHNLTLLARLDRLAELGCPLLVGLSRKSMLGALTGRDVRGRTPAGVAAAVLALARGAAIIRTHDVAATQDAIRVFAAVGAAA